MKNAKKYFCTLKLWTSWCDFILRNLADQLADLPLLAARGVTAAGLCAS
jgi:hypothetical protein